MQLAGASVLMNVGLCASGQGAAADAQSVRRMPIGMNLRLISVAALGAALAIIAGRWLALYGGENARLELLITLIGIYAALSLGTSTLQWLFDRRMRQADPELLAHLEALDPEVAAAIADRTRVNEQRDWSWLITAAAWAVVAVAAPLTLLPWLRAGGELTPDTPIHGADILAVVVAVVMYVVVRRHALRHYHCRRCRKPLPRLDGGTPRYACARCGIVWRLS